MKKNVDDYITEGIYGKKQLNPSERKLYLGSLRERVILALTKAQVMKNKGLKEVEIAMRENQGSKLLLNGAVGYRFFKPYKKLASKYKIPYTSVKNKEARSEYGLLLTYDHAIDKEDILLIDNDDKDGHKEQSTNNSNFLENLFQLFKK